LHRMGRGGSVSNSRKKAPFAFYEATCLLKDELRRGPELYAAFEWGFLNWAFDYCLWNIRTMDDAEARAAMLRRLAQGGFPELELDRHTQAYFGLVPDNVEHYFELLEEAGMAAGDGALPTLAHPGLELPIKFLEQSRREGYGPALHKVRGKVFGQSDEARLRDARLERGRVFFPRSEGGEDR